MNSINIQPKQPNACAPGGVANESRGGGYAKLRIAALLLLALVATELRLRAQRVGTDFVFHVYVDPTFGDDEEAFALNPGNRSLHLVGGILSPVDPELSTFAGWPTRQRPRPLDRRVDIDPVDNSQNNANYAITGVLQQAPYAFRTLSGERGAIEYVNRVFAIADPNGGPLPIVDLPWAHPGGAGRVTHVIIHCLPGLYGPKSSAEKYAIEIDPTCGLPWNGEQFPVVLGGRKWGPPGANGLFDRVSIQGTSALDTIFDARGDDPGLPAAKREVDLIQVISGGGGTHQHEDAFIDGITLRNTPVSPAGWVNRGSSRGAGIHIFGFVGRIRIAITNCFLAENVAGIVIDASGSQAPGVDTYGQHEPIICGNTFFNNRIGIWCGQLTNMQPAPSTSAYVNLHAPLVINNVFWADDPSDSAYEGLDATILQLDVVNGAVLPSPQDFNAWWPSQANAGFQVGQLGWFGWGMSIGGNPVAPPPRVNLTGCSHLFVRQLMGDAFANDLRLTPWASINGSTAINAPNPLLGMGVSLVTPSGGLPGIRSRIGTGLSRPPGLPAGAEEVPIHGWDYDCEGFGNPRLEQRIGAASSSFGSADLGADQCGQLIMAGYVPWTRMFDASTYVPGIVPFNIYSYIYFLDAPNVTARPRPDSIIVVGSQAWSSNVRQAPMALPVSPLTYVPAGAVSYFTQGFEVSALPGPSFQLSERAFLYAQGIFGPFPRNLTCDFSAHLLRDPHPAWATLFSTVPFFGWFPPQLADPYACNPEYCSWPVSRSLSTFCLDNPALYHDLGGVPLGPGGWLGAFNQFAFVSDGHINPPGSTRTSGTYRFLPPTPGPFGPGPCGQLQITTDAFGIGACPDVVPDLGLDLGVRVNCEIPASSLSGTNSNLQTFLVVPSDILSVPIWGAARPQPSEQQSTTDVMWRIPASEAGSSLAVRFGLSPTLGREAEARRTLLGDQGRQGGVR